MILNNRIKVGVLTSSRADYGIYKPLLSLVSIDDRIDLNLIVFGMHLQKQHGETIKEIIDILKKEYEAAVEIQSKGSQYL